MSTTASKVLLPELNLAKLYKRANEDVGLELGSGRGIISAVVTGGQGQAPASGGAVQVYRGRRFIASQRAEALTLRHYIPPRLHSKVWDSTPPLSASQRFGNNTLRSSLRHGGLPYGSGGGVPPPLSDRSYDRRPSHGASSKPALHTQGSQTERAMARGGQEGSLVPQLPALGPREGGVLITALDAKAMKLHPPMSRGSSFRRRRGQLRRLYSRRQSNGGTGGANPNSSAISISNGGNTGTGGAGSNANLVLQGTSSRLMQKQQSQHVSSQAAGLGETARGSALAADVIVPLTPAEVLSIKGHTLTPHEVREIQDYPLIYYVGQKRGHRSAQKKAANAGAAAEGGEEEAVHNDGFDDSRGDYHVVKHDHLAYRYEILGSLGKGSFGQVWRCLDHQTQSEVAVKIVRNKKRFRQQGEIEVKILKHVRDRDLNSDKNVIHFIDSFYFRNHLCIAFPLMSLNLYDFLKERNFKGLSLVEINYLARQLLAGLSFLQQERIVHCDLKPENILLREENRLAVVLIDFGSSCYQDQTLYTYIQSRFYRSPEVLLGLPYGSPIDMWSFGCILAELLTGFPLFPGENEVDQMSCIMEMLGAIPAWMSRDGIKAKRFFNEADGSPILGQTAKGVPRRLNGTTLQDALLRGSEDQQGFVGFLEATLRIDPNLRATADQAAQHDWMTSHPHRPQSKQARNLGSPNLRPSMRRIYDPSLQPGLHPSQQQLAGAPACDSMSGPLKASDLQRRARNSNQVLPTAAHHLQQQQPQHPQQDVVAATMGEAGAHHHRLPLGDLAPILSGASMGTTATTQQAPPAASKNIALNKNNMP